jgi:addiction module HigA family antidote
MRNRVTRVFPNELRRSARRKLVYLHEATSLGWTKTRLNESIKGKRGITAESALDLADALGTSAKLWMNLQTTCDLDKAEKARIPRCYRRRLEWRGDHRAQWPLRSRNAPDKGGTCAAVASAPTSWEHYVDPCVLRFAVCARWALGATRSLDRRVRQHLPDRNAAAGDVDEPPFLGPFVGREALRGCSASARSSRI